MTSKPLNTRELSKETAKVLRTLPRTGPRLVTRDGKTVGILIPPSGRGIEADIDLLSRLRMAQAFDASRKEAVLEDVDGISMEEIDREIRAARRERKHRPVSLDA